MDCWEKSIRLWCFKPLRFSSTHGHAWGVGLHVIQVLMRPAWSFGVVMVEIQIFWSGFCYPAVQFFHSGDQQGGEPSRLCGSRNTFLMVLTPFMSPPLQDTNTLIATAIALCSANCHLHPPPSPSTCTKNPPRHYWMCWIPTACLAPLNFFH